MTDQIIYETILPGLIFIIISLLCAEFIGRNKHIGRNYTFFMMLGIIPGIIGLILSPMTSKPINKANSLYNYLGFFLILGTIFGIIGILENTDSLALSQIFAFTSLLSAAFYCLDLAKGKIINNQPKNYFEKFPSQKPEIKKIEQEKKELNDSIESLTNLKNIGIITESFFNEKIEIINSKQAEKNLQNSLEYKQLQKLQDYKIITNKEFTNKIKLIKPNVPIINSMKIEIENELISIEIPSEEIIQLSIKFIPEKPKILNENWIQYEIIFKDNIYVYLINTKTGKKMIDDNGKIRQFNSLEDLILYIIK